MERVKRLAKLVSEAIKKPNATTRHLRQYPVSDKEMAKPVKKPEKKEKKENVTEAVPYSYGFIKPPRKGSVAYNAIMKRKEQDKNRVKEIEAIGTKNHHVGVAKVTKEQIEDVTETYKYIDQSGGHEIKGKSGTFVGYTHSATKGKGANILKHNKTGKYYAAGGSSTAFTAKTTLHDSPQAAANAYHKGNLAEENDQLDEAIKLNSKVKIHAPGKDYHGKVGHVGEIRKGLHDKAPKTYTVDYDYDTKTGNKKSIQLDKSNLKMHNEETEIDEAYMGKVKLASNPREKWMKSVKDRGYDMRAGAQRLQDLLDKQKKERAEMEQRAKEKGLEY
jgi:hypothetical protein